MWYREHIGGNRIRSWTHGGEQNGNDPDHAAAWDHDHEARLGDAAVSGCEAARLGGQGNEVGPGSGGYLVLKRPWPAMLRGIYNDDKRYRETYWSKYGEVSSPATARGSTRTATSGYSAASTT